MSSASKGTNLVSKVANFYHCSYAVYLMWPAMHRVGHDSGLQWSRKASSNLSTTQQLVIILDQFWLRFRESLVSYLSIV